jgi:heme/copper-type cytochrome/quinol oxidase subunit 4
MILITPQVARSQNLRTKLFNSLPIYTFKLSQYSSTTKRKEIMFMFLNCGLILILPILHFIYLHADVNSQWLIIIVIIIIIIIIIIFL